jgi:hypothetical protein
LANFIFSSAAVAQSIRQIESRMEKHHWQEARQLLIKSLHKDTGNIELKWITAQWFFNNHNPNRQIDSSYLFLQKTISSFRTAEERQRERLKRQYLDEPVFQAFKQRLDSAAFERSKQINTVAAYQFFIEHFPSAIEKDKAIELRNEVAFLDALKQNTYQSFQAYFQTYTDSHRAEEARKRYDKLLYQSKTKDGRMESFSAFIKEFPNSSFRRQAERYLFERCTVLGDSTDFTRFIRNFPTSPFCREALDLAYYIFSESGEATPTSLVNDSLRHVQLLHQDYWIPFLSNGKYGFMNSVGHEVLAPTFASIDPSYKCGTIEADVLITSEGLIARNGKKVSPFSKVMEPIGLGFWIVGDSTCMHLLHASGKKIISDCFRSVQLIGNRFLWISGGTSEGIYSLTGRLLLKGNWRSVDWMRNVLVLTQLEKKTIVTIEDIRHLAEGIPFTPQHVYDDVKIVSNNSLLVRNGSLEGILDFGGRFIIPLARQVLALEPFGLVRKTDDNFFLDEVDKQFAGKKVKQYKHYGNWLSLSTNQGVEVWDIQKKKFLPAMDSCWFAAGLLFTKNAEATSIYLSATVSLSFKNEQKVTLVKSRDSIRAFFTNEGKQRKTVYAIATGAKLFTSNFDDLESIDANHFLISLKNKKGIISSQGKIILPTEYDLLAVNQGFYWSTFKDKKFGLINLATGSLLKPLSTRNVIIVNDEYLAIFNNGKYGFVNGQGKPLTKLEYDDILPWNNHLIWVKKSFTWSLIDLMKNKVIVDTVKKFDKWLDLQKDKLYRIQKNDLYGIVTSEKGVVIPPQFSYVKNLGSLEKPLYFTDKEVEEAGVHVVIYYDSDGKLIRKQVYEEEEFESLVCEMD